MGDINALATAVFKSVEAYVAKAFANLTARVDGIEKAVRDLPPPEPGRPGDPGAAGKDADPAAVAALLLPELQKTISDWPKPSDGKDGEHGAPGDPGQPGRPGDPGAAGKDADPAAVAALLLPELQKTISDWPKPSDGANGRDGKDGEHGKSVTVDDVLPAFELLMTKALLDFERRSADVLQRAIERMPVPKDGKDGRDGMAIDALQALHDGDGNVTLRFTSGDVVKESTIRLPRFKDCGVYRDTEPYQQGDGVTWGGSFWIAQKDAPQGKPGAVDSGWRLAVKAGRDGKSFDAPQPSPGPVRIK